MNLERTYNDNFTFEGFNPTGELKSLCKDIFNFIEDRSPSESSKIAFVKKDGDSENYQGMIKIISASGSIIVIASNVIPRLMIQDLYDQFSRKIELWKSRRDF